MIWITWIGWPALVVLTKVGAQGVPEDLLQWWSQPFLERFHAVRQEWAAQRQPVGLEDGLEEYRAVIHCHSFLSHDSRGTLPELLAAAHATGTRVVMMTEHPSPERDVYAQGWHGFHDGVLFIPGAETRNLLVWPRTLRDQWEAPSRSAFVERIRNDGGLVFICHPDSFDEWELPGVQGMEIYNIHADALDDPELRGLWSGSLDFSRLLPVVQGFEQYPLEALAAIFDEPQEFVRRWDDLLQKGPLTGIAGNDAHQNTGWVLRVGEGRQLEIWSTLQEKLAVLEMERVPFFRERIISAPPGTEVARFQLDPYPLLFQFVGTYVLAPELSEDAIRSALRAGRAYVAFDWLAEARGFTAVLEGQGQRWTLGDRVAFQPGLRVRAEAPLEAHWRLVRNGTVVQTGAGRSFEAEPAEPGVYRLEVRLSALEREWPWIYANPFYLLAGPRE
jgi:hypothetical protein